MPFKKKSSSKSITTNALEQSLHDREEKYHKTFLNSIDNMFTLDPKNGDILDISYSSSATFGYSREEFLGMNITDLDKAAVDWFKKIGNDNFFIETSMRCKDGSFREVQVDIKYLKLSKGPLLHTHVRDMNERKLAEEKLRQSEERLRLFMDSATEGVSLLDSKLNYLMVNNEWLKSRGNSKREDVLGKNIIDIIPDIKETPRYLEYKKVIKTGEPFIASNVLIKKGRHEAFYDINAFKVGEGLGVLTIDNTENKKSEDELRNAYNTVHNILEKAPFGIYVVNKEGTVEYVNPKMVEITTYSLEEFMNLNILERPNLKRLGIADKIMNVFNGESFFEGPVSYTSHDKKKRTIRNFVGIPLMEYGEQKALIFVEDITERMLAKEELERSYQTMRNILDKSPYGILLINSKGMLEYANPRMEEISGDTPEYLKTLNVFKLATYKAAGIDTQVHDVFKGKSFFAGPIDYTSEFSGKKTIRNFIGIPLTEYGEQKALIFVEDITERMLAKEELERSYQTMRNILDKSPFGIYLANHKGNMEYVNPKMLEISGDLREDFMKFNTFQMHSYKKFGIDENLRDVFKGKSFFKGPVDYVSKPGGKVTIRNFMGIPLVEQGEKKALVFIEDITKRKTAERELAKAYEDLKSLDVIKDDFINTTSHALKTPLTSITSFTDLLHGEKLGLLNERQKDGLEVIKSEARRLNILINHILDSSKIEAGQFVLHTSKINFTGLVADSVTSCSRPAKAKGNEIKLNSPGIIYVNADPFWIEKVVDNLISNSVKFTDKGKIEVTVKKMDHTVKFVIKDNGRGMDKKHIKHIFDKFYQAEQQTATGTGLGLYISKKLVDAHRGKIGCISKGRGKGSTFWFTLPNS